MTGTTKKRRLISAGRVAYVRDNRYAVAYSYSEFLEEVGKRLRKMRIERGWTLRQMITVHGYHLAHWQGFEKGKGMSIPSLLRVCDTFEIKLEVLIAGVGWIEGNDTQSVPGKSSMEAPQRAANTPTAKSSASPAESPRRGRRRIS